MVYSSNPYHKQGPDSIALWYSSERMQIKSQSTINILMIRPKGFVFNEETAASNAFQKLSGENDLTARAVEEFDNAVAILKAEGVNVLVFDDDPQSQSPDAVFPNNWVTFHSDGTVILYPMHASNRRGERRPDIIEALQQDFTINSTLDLSQYENENRYLEGTGSIVFDHAHAAAYACISPRTDKGLFRKVCDHLSYHPINFHARDPAGKEIYHTNVMMCVASQLALLCRESINDAGERDAVTNSLAATGREIIDISFEQMNGFAGNMLELSTREGNLILASSQSAFDILRPAQKETIEQYCKLVPLPIPIIESVGGGSARCMIAEIFLKSFK